MTTSVRQLSSSQLENSVSVLADLLTDVVNGGASMGFHAPLSHDEARAYWLSLRRELHAGTRVILVAHHNGCIVGSGQLALAQAPNARHRAELQKLIVCGAMQGRGVGKLIVAALHDAARERGRSLILLGARPGRPERFYKALGYSEIGVIPGYATGPTGERFDSISLYQELRVNNGNAGPPLAALASG